MSRKRIFSSAKAQVQFSIAFEELFENCIKAKQLFTFINMGGFELNEGSRDGRDEHENQIN